jgi:hypothetical protein
LKDSHLSYQGAPPPLSACHRTAGRAEVVPCWWQPSCPTLAGDSLVDTWCHTCSSTRGAVTSAKLVSSSASAWSSGWIDLHTVRQVVPAAGQAGDRGVLAMKLTDRPRTRPCGQQRSRTREIALEFDPSPVGQVDSPQMPAACATPPPQAVACAARRPAAPCAGRGGGRSTRRLSGPLPWR